MTPDPSIRVTAITQIYLNASTSPCLVTTETGQEWVMKLRGSGPGPVALLTELVGLRAASAMGLEVPETRPLYLPPNFPWSIGTDEFDGIVQRSFGWNLGICFVPDAATATPEQVLASDARFLGALSQVDRLLSNTDRTSRNTNILDRPAGLVAIDFDACLFLRRALKGAVPAKFALSPGHLLEDARLPGHAQEIDEDLLGEALRDAPDEWLQIAGISRADLVANLRRYAAAWNESASPA